METQGSREVEMAIRAGLAAPKVLAALKGLLALEAENTRQCGSDIEYLRERLREDSRIANAQGAIAYLEGTVAPEEPIFGWSIRGAIHELPDRECAAFEKAGIMTIGDLLAYAPEELIVLEGVGLRGLYAVELALERSHGMKLARPATGPSPDHQLFTMSYDVVLRNEPRRLPDALEDAGIKTVGDLLEWTVEELIELEGIGSVAIACIEDGLRYFGLELASADEREAVTA